MRRSKTVLTTDAPKDNQGRGESFSPTDLVATALGSCILTMMGMMARPLNVDLAGSTATVEKEMTSTPPRMIQRLATKIRVPLAVSDDEPAEDGTGRSYLSCTQKPASGYRKADRVYLGIAFGAGKGSDNGLHSRDARG